MDTFEINPKYALYLFDWEPKLAPSVDLSGWRATLKLGMIEVLYVFGVGDGSAYQQLKNWLQEKPERRLIFIENEPGFIASAIQSSFPLLFDPQVSLEYLERGLLQELAERYPVNEVEMVALPLYQNGTFRKIRLELLRKTALSFSLFIDRLYSHHLFENFVRNVPQVATSFYGNAMKGAFKGIPAIICGAGPSLQRAFEILRTLEGRALIIAGGSAIAALSQAGIEPHFAIAIDPNIEEFRRMQNSFAFECPFLFSTRVHPSIFQTCNGPFGYLRAGVGGAAELWMEEQYGLSDPLLGEHLSDESNSVTTIAIAFAEHVGCSTILLEGLDLAYTGGRRYASGICEEALKLDEHGADQIMRKKDKHGKWVQTAVRWVIEAGSIAHYAKKHPTIQWINTTEGGLLISGIPQMPLSVAVSQYLGGQFDLRGMIARQIALNPMPDLREPILSKLSESLARVISHLEVLSGNQLGSKSLAQLDLEEEIAFSVLFYDSDKVLKQALNRLGGCKWTLFLQMAKKYILS
jgi:hypothetical protein